MEREFTYIDIEFKDSPSFTTVMTSTKEQLLYRLPYVKGAIKYHTENNNPGQIKFFTDELKLIEKRLKKN